MRSDVNLSSKMERVTSQSHLERGNSVNDMDSQFMRTTHAKIKKNRSPPHGLDSLIAEEEVTLP